jgi:hypothetical protein
MKQKCNVFKRRIYDVVIDESLVNLISLSVIAYVTAMMIYVPLETAYI